MIFELDGIEVFFPYAHMYPEQKTYMKELKDVVVGRGHCLLEMPTGTGKTITLLSFLVSYQIFLKTGGAGVEKVRKDPGLIKNEASRFRDGFKIVYCTRTISETEKVMDELKSLVSYIEREVGFPLGYTGIGICARRNLCINQEVLASKSSVELDAACQERTSQWARSEEGGGKRCEYYEKFLETSPHLSIAGGIYTFDEIREYGKEEAVCPYFLTRGMLSLADCVVYTYNYIIDPRIYEIISKGFGANSVVVFDEAHNIDNACIEAMSINITRSTLDSAWKCVQGVQERIELEQRKGMSEIALEYERIRRWEREGVPDERGGNTLPEDSVDSADVGTGPYIGPTVNQSNPRHSALANNVSAIPGSMRRAEHFLSVLKRVLEFFKTKIKTTHLTTETTDSFCASVRENVFVERKALSYVSFRLNILLRTLGMGLSENVRDLTKICDFCAIASQYKKGFSVIFEPFDPKNNDVYDPILRMSCLDASIPLKKIFSTFKNVVITSGTLSPIEMYPKILDFVPVKSVEINTTLASNRISPLIITKGSDQMTLAMETETHGMPSSHAGNTITTTFSLRAEPAVIRNYGNLLLEFSKIVPDGLVCFFPSYRYMEQIISAWTDSGVLYEIMENKLVFIETADLRETEFALESYRSACESGRGAVFLSVARGKISEGVDFLDEYGRAVIVLGIPYQYTESARLRRRLDFLADEFGVREQEFLSFDAMRQTSQCVGRVLRNKRDYGLIVLADRRFDTNEKKSKLPKWIQRYLEQGCCNLSIDMAISIGRQFFRRVAQPLEDGVWETLLSGKG